MNKEHFEFYYDELDKILKINEYDPTTLEPIIGDIRRIEKSLKRSNDFFEDYKLFFKELEEVKYKLSLLPKDRWGNPSGTITNVLYQYKTELEKVIKTFSDTMREESSKFLAILFLELLNRENVKEELRLYFIEQFINEEK